MKPIPIELDFFSEMIRDDSRPFEYPFQKWSMKWENGSGGGALISNTNPTGLTGSVRIDRDVTRGTAY